MLTLGASKWQQARRYYLFLSYTVCIVSIPLLQIILSPLVTEVNARQTFHFHLIIFFSINTVIIIIRDLVMMREKNTAIELENTQLKMKNLEAANNRLTQQIQPHFLFNSLSTLKTLITQSPNNAEEYLLKLSGFLRYSLTNNRLNVARVQTELNTCIDYLEMQKIRFGMALQFTADVPADIQTHYWMPVFSIQALAENAIKHNTLTLQQPLQINIGFKENKVFVTNNLQPRAKPETTGGIGLANLNERYIILSGEGIDICQTPNQFCVSLKVFDNENCNYRR